VKGNTPRYLSISCSCCVLMAGIGAFAQDDVTFKSEVKVVNVLANVTDKHGAIVNNLTKDDFVLLENGRPQTIQYFSRETDLPLTLGLLVDTSGSQERVLTAERVASFRFLDNVLREGTDQVFLMQFDIGVYLRQKLTSRRKDLEDTLSQVDTQTRQELSQYGGGTRLYDAVVKASLDIMRGQSHRKALILLTDGEDVGSDGTLQNAIEAAQRAETMVYSILFSDHGGFGGEGGRGVLERLSRETGGGFFEVTKKQDIQQIYRLIQEQLRTQYNLGFVSDQPAKYSEFRKLQLTAKEKGLLVQVRNRYWAKR
jgi:VWFA-related protein